MLRRYGLVRRLSNLQRALNRAKIFWEILSQAPNVPFARGFEDMTPPPPPTHTHTHMHTHTHTPGKYFNLEAKKCHFCCSNTTISVKYFRYFLQFLQFLEHQSKVFCISFSFMRIWRKHHSTSRHRHFLYPLISYWSEFGIFKQNQDSLRTLSNDETTKRQTATILIC